MSKYDWANVHEKINAIATCEDGSVKWFCDPIPSNGSWIVSFTVTGGIPFKGDWRESLEERPK